MQRLINHPAEFTDAIGLGNNRCTTYFFTTLWINKRVTDSIKKSFCLRLVGIDLIDDILSFRSGNIGIQNKQVNFFICSSKLFDDLLFIAGGHDLIIELGQ